MTNRKRTSQEASERSNDPYEEKLTRKYTDSLTKDDGVSKIIKSYNYQKNLQEYRNAQKGANQFEEKYAMGGSVRGCGKAMRGYGKANYSKKNI